MSTHHHTRAPWTVRKDEGGSFSIVSKAKDGGTIARVWVAPGAPEATAANARLIAEAPRLLDCLEELLEHIEWRRRTAGETTGPNDCTHRARAAIADATRPGTWSDA